MNIQSFIQKLPKTDLHCHLDGSLRAETVLEIAREEKLLLADLSIQELKKILLCGEKVSTLPVFLKGFEINTQVMQTAKALERITFELLEDAAKENVHYLEIRLYTGFLLSKGLTDESAIEAINKGIKKAKEKFGIESGIILCAIRAFSPEKSEELAKIAVSMKSENVIGFDLANKERGYPARDHKKAFDIAANGGLGITLHAGEDEAPWSIEDAIDYCHAQRIGHGRTLIDDERLIQKVIDKNIFIEACPSSNVQIGLTSEFSQHPLRELLEKGVKVTLNTDNRLLTGINVSDEYFRCHQFLGMTEKQLKQIAINGFEAAFLDESKKKTLIQKIQNEISKF
jgi:adenosine deaminase